MYTANQALCFSKGLEKMILNILPIMQGQQLKVRNMLIARADHLYVNPTLHFNS